MKKKILVMIIACCVLTGLAACGKDTKADTKDEVVYIDESYEELPVEDSVTLEIGAEEEAELVS